MPTSQNIAHALDEGRSSNGAAPPRRYPPLGVVIKNAGSGQLQRILADEVELRSRCEEEGLDYQTGRSMIDSELDRRRSSIHFSNEKSYSAEIDVVRVDVHHEKARRKSAARSKAARLKIDQCEGEEQQRDDELWQPLTSGAALSRARRTAACRRFRERTGVSTLLRRELDEKV